MQPFPQIYFSAGSGRPGTPWVPSHYRQKLEILGGPAALQTSRLCKSYKTLETPVLLRRIFVLIAALSLAACGGAPLAEQATAESRRTEGPAAPVLPRVSEFAANANLKDVYFDFDKYDIRPDAAKILDANATWLKANPGNLLLIEGHCDERGTAEYNLALGERRAKSTMNYLVGQGVAASRITVISYGKERPVCTEKTEACWAMNRRAHHLVKAQ